MQRKTYSLAHAQSAAPRRGRLLDAFLSSPTERKEERMLIRRRRCRPSNAQARFEALIRERAATVGDPDAADALLRAARSFRRVLPGNLLAAVERWSDDEMRATVERMIRAHRGGP